MEIVAFVLVWVILSMVTRSEDISVNIREHMAEDPLFIRNHHDVSEHIKNSIKKEYVSNSFDKREQIVRLLRQLTEYEDPGDFLEQYQDIYSYIFNPYQ